MLMFSVQDLKLDSMTAAWLLPVVPAVVAAGTGAVVASTLPRQHALDTLLVLIRGGGVPPWQRCFASSLLACFSCNAWLLSQ